MICAINGDDNTDSLTFVLQGSRDVVGSAELTARELRINASSEFIVGLADVRNEEEFWAFIESIPGYTALETEHGTYKAIVLDPAQSGVAMIGFEVDQPIEAGKQAAMFLSDSTDPATSQPVQLVGEVTLTFGPPDPPVVPKVPMLPPCPYGVTHMGDFEVQAKLVAGNGIVISDANVISATGAGDGKHWYEYALWEQSADVNDLFTAPDHMYAPYLCKYPTAIGTGSDGKLRAGAVIPAGLGAVFSFITFEGDQSLHIRTASVETEGTVDEPVIASTSALITISATSLSSIQGSRQRKTGSLYTWYTNGLSLLLQLSESEAAEFGDMVYLIA